MWQLTNHPAELKGNMHLCHVWAICTLYSPNWPHIDVSQIALGVHCTLVNV
jgi:hypothetical protein